MLWTNSSPEILKISSKTWITSLHSIVNVYSLFKLYRKTVGQTSFLQAADSIRRTETCVFPKSKKSADLTLAPGKLVRTSFHFSKSAVLGKLNFSILYAIAFAQFVLDRKIIVAKASGAYLKIIFLAKIRESDPTSFNAQNDCHLWATRSNNLFHLKFTPQHSRKLLLTWRWNKRAPASSRSPFARVSPIELKSETNAGASRRSNDVDELIVSTIRSERPRTSRWHLTDMRILTPPTHAAVFRVRASFASSVTGNWQQYNLCDYYFW